MLLAVALRGMVSDSVPNALLVSAGGFGILFALQTWVVSAANGGELIHVVLDQDGDLGGTGNAKGVKVRVGLVKVAVLAEKTTNRLAGGALSARPLGLLVAGRAGVRAVVAVRASTRGDGVDVGESSREERLRVLDTGPAVIAKMVDGNRAVVRWEGVA